MRYILAHSEAGGRQEFYNYRELAVMLADYVKKMGYTHVELMPVMEHPVRRFLGLSGDGLLCPYRQLRHTGRLYVFRE